MKRTNNKQIIITVMICAVIVFIWLNSFLPPNTSSEISGRFENFLIKIFGSDSEISDFIHKFIRKIGHFIEFGLLGMAAALLFNFDTNRKWQGIVNFLFFGLSVAFLDESIQLFNGRGPSVKDIWIDMSGYVLFGFLMRILLAVTGRRKHKR